MGKGIFYFLVFLFFIGRASAQEEPTYTDTVIIEKAPVIIKKEVYLPPLKKKHISEGAWKVGPYVAIGKTKAESSHASISITGNAYSQLGIELKHQVGNLEIGTGLGLYTTSITQSVQQERQVTDRITHMILDTLSCYTIILPGEIITKCNYDTSYTSQDVTHIEKYSVEEKHTLQYLQIPLSLGYILKAGKWYLTPTVQLMYNTLISSREEYRSNNWMIGGQLALGYMVAQRWTAEAKTQMLVHLTSPAENQRKWTTAGFGLGLFYHF